MKYKSIAIPRPSIGLDCSLWVNETVPDQAMSLQTILERFVRGEPMDVRMHGQASKLSNVEDFDNPLNIDYEKLGNADLVEKQEFSDFLSSVQRRYQSEEKARQASAYAKKQQLEHEELRRKIAAEEAAKLNSGKSAQ